MSVCQTITFESLDVGSSYLHSTFGISPGNTGQVRIWRSSGQSQDHRSKTLDSPYSRNVKLRSHITPVQGSIKMEPCGLRVSWVLDYGISTMADRMVWPPSLPRDRKWPRISTCTHSQVIGLGKLSFLFTNFSIETQLVTQNVKSESHQVNWDTN